MKQRMKAGKASASGSSLPPERIVGIGASAGGLEAFTELLRNLSLDLNAAYILVQHLDPSHRSLLSELLARTTQLQVREITNNTRIEGNQIYVIPPNSDLRVVGGVLKLSPRKKTGGPARSIDNFLTSLLLRQQPSELEQLHQDLLIGVSSFFRNPSVFEQLKQRVFPRLVKSVSGADSLSSLKRPIPVFFFRLRGLELALILGHRGGLDFDHAALWNGLLLAVQPLVVVVGAF